MTRITLSLEDATPFTPLEDGNYECVVSEISDPKQGAKSTYITAILKIAEGEERAGYPLYVNYPITGPGAGMFAEFWLAATGEELEFGGTLDIDIGDLIGARVTAVTKLREYPEGSGDFRPEVRKVLKA